MHIKISVYNQSAFTKYGKLKKRAMPELGRAMVDVEPHTEGATDDFIAETAAKIKKDYTAFTSPYIFTHIIATNKQTGESVRIFEDVAMNGQYVMTSPIKLLKLLTA